MEAQDRQDVLDVEQNIQNEPTVHEARCAAKGVTFTETHAMIALADGRIIGVPLSWFPLLEAASGEERQNYELLGLNVYWLDIDDGIDLTALLTGLYLKPTSAYMDSIKAQIAARSQPVT